MKSLSKEEPPEGAAILTQLMSLGTDTHKPKPLRLPLRWSERRRDRNEALL